MPTVDETVQKAKRGIIDDSTLETLLAELEEAERAAQTATGEDPSARRQVSA